MGRQPEWTQVRKYLSHDWLKHSFLPVVASAFNVERGLVLEDRQGSSLAAIQSLWAAATPAFQRLIDSFEQEMSPRTLFESGPLAECDDDTKSWLPQLAHSIWWHRVDAAELLEGTETAFAEVERLVDALRNPTPIENDGPADHLRELYQACERLEELLCRFPRAIIIA